MRKLLLSLAAASVLVAPATAEAWKPSYQDRLDAKRFARSFWADRGEYVPCGGVRLAWVSGSTVRRAFGHGTLAAVFRGGCTVYYNEAVGWSWRKLCSVTVHEYGHLIGHGHSWNPDSIMYPSYYGSNWWPRHWSCDYSWAQRRS